ncbi:MAG: type II 3-dehydroquinate dehydratase [Spirochaetes bacterium]|nr:type II 3-dehydroquinate dehydratase [Spirochaetota bacterium]
MNVLVIEGPNINMLGIREKSTYGAMSMDEIHTMLKDHAGSTGVTLSFFQSNSEGDIITTIQKAHGTVDYIIINPAAYTHTSVGIRDALLAVNIPAVEVHLSNIFKRETFRHHSFISDIAVGVVSGFGSEGYRMALDFIIAQGRKK